MNRIVPLSRSRITNKLLQRARGWTRPERSTDERRAPETATPLFRLHGCRGARVLDGNDTDLISASIVDEDDEHPPPRAEDVPEPVPPASQLFTAFRESSQLTQPVSDPRTRVAGKVEPLAPNPEILHRRGGDDHLRHGFRTRRAECPARPASHRGPAAPSRMRPE
jgi:hypothetical protein